MAPPDFEEPEPDTQSDLPPITDPELLAALESTPTERTPIPPPDEAPNVSEIRTLRSPPPVREEDEPSGEEPLRFLQNIGIPGEGVAILKATPHDQQVRLARKS
jgi:hypothetical protein